MVAPRRVVLATGNAGKQREFAALLAPLGFDIVLQSALGIAPAEETGSTFHDNALIKARHAARLGSLPALADDSGLEVDALGGRPGVHSARYGGLTAGDVENNELLMHELRHVPDQARSARYCCVIAFVRTADDPAPVVTRGIWEGRIATRFAGSGGFGYDPLFIPAGYAVTAAQMTAAEKNEVSHRAAALAHLLKMMQLVEPLFDHEK